MPLRPTRARPYPEGRPEAIVIGGSAGAVGALSTLLPALPRGYALPVLVVVHLSAGRKSALPELFQSKCQVAVIEAEDKEPIHAGTVYFAPPNYHLLVERQRSISLCTDHPVHYSRPSIDVLFESAAQAYGPALVGIVLTGASQDGAQGLRAIAHAGGLTLVQAPELAEMPTMPAAALEACPSAWSMSLEQMAAFLQQLAAGTSPHAK